MYKIKEQLSSHTWKVEHEKKPFIMKKISLTGLTNNKRKYLLSELKIISEHNCRHIIKYYNSFIQDDCLCIITEYCSGGTLGNKQGLSPVKIWRYFAQICSALLYLHGNNIIHRDLIMENIMIDSNDNIKLIGFGMTKIMNEYMKYTKSVVGLPCPETQKHGFYDQKVDIWCAGLILYQMTHDRKPDTERLVIHPSVPTGFQIVIKKCTCKSPHARPKIDDLIKYSEIKRYLVSTSKIPTKIKQINSVPHDVAEWKKHLPKSKHINNIDCDFMKHYTNEELVFLNMRLIDTIIEKNNIIATLKSQIRMLNKQ
jgi:NIMA (never in mitosis gene a)-related kinase